MYQSQATMDKFDGKNAELVKTEIPMLKILSFILCETKIQIEQILIFKATVDFKPALSALCDNNKIEFCNITVQLKQGQ